MIVWMAADGGSPRPIGMSINLRLSLFFGGFALIVFIPALWSRVMARYVAIANLHRSLARFSWGTQIARLMIPLWFGVGVFALGWVRVVDRALGPIGHWPVDLPGAIVGTMPAMLAWMGLWWASFPADRALREQSLLLQLQDGLPIHSPPGFWNYFGANLRMQLLFTVVPIAAIMFLRDIASSSLWWGLGVNLRAAKLNEETATSAAKIIEYCLLPISAALVFLFAPEILRRVLHTEPLPDSTLRRRLEEICQRSKLRYRDILLWHTGNSMGNAAVMGVIPQVRYILLSDLLLETMTDRQIEAVFAHEAGHVVHRHIAWYAVFVIVIMSIFVVLGEVARMLGIELAFIPQWMRDPLLMMISVATMFLLFGVLSRWFERQADVYAARIMERQLASGSEVRASDFPTRPIANATIPRLRPMHSPGTFVGELGAMVFASALQRVAVVNNIPIAARNFSHGSIKQRMGFLRHLSADPSRTARFDRRMKWIYLSLIVTLAVSVVWVGAIAWRG